MSGGQASAAERTTQIPGTLAVVDFPASHQDSDVAAPPRFILIVSSDATKRRFNPAPQEAAWGSPYYKDHPFPATKNIFRALKQSLLVGLLGDKNTYSLSEFS